ncbi:hypothetical protein ACLOJK_019432 [Asimina triloba]
MGCRLDFVVARVACYCYRSKMVETCLLLIKEGWFALPSTDGAATLIFSAIIGVVDRRRWRWVSQLGCFVVTVDRMLLDLARKGKESRLPSPDLLKMTARFFCRCLDDVEDPTSAAMATPLMKVMEHQIWCSDSAPNLPMTVSDFAASTEKRYIMSFSKLTPMNAMDTLQDFIFAKESSA